MAGDDRTRATLLANEHHVPVVACTGGRVLAANRAAAALFGEIPDGAGVLSLFHPHSRDKLRDLLARPPAPAVTELLVARGNELPRTVPFLLLPDVAHEWLIVACASSEAQVEEPSAKLLEANDRLVELTRRLSRTVHDAEAEREALQQLGNLRELFVAAMAHDLKSPLQAILLSEELLKNSTDSGASFDAPQHVTRVERQAQRMLTLIDSLLLLARLDSTAPGLPTEPLDLCSVARETTAAFENLAQGSDVRIELACDSQASVHGNRVWLGEVFANLLSNAVRHSPRAGRITVAIDPDGDKVLCRVCDQGAGIPDAARATIFDRYVQHSESKGTAGLGLYVSRRVIELHGGRIWVDSAPGGGAQFAFELPALVAGDSS